MYQAVDLSAVWLIFCCAVIGNLGVNKGILRYS
nr:MAG TPA: hypothetical protein [Bacteriophage sp.]